MRNRTLMALLVVLTLACPAAASGADTGNVQRAPKLAGPEPVSASGSVASAPVGGTATDDDIPGIPLPASPVAGTLDLVDSADVYAVALTAGQEFVVDMTGDPGTDFDLYLYGPTAPSISESGYIVAESVSGTSTEHIAFTAWSDGTYYLDVERQVGGGGAYTLTWSTPAPEADDDIPGVVLPATPVVGALDMGADAADVFAVTLSAHDLITLDLTGAAGTDFDIYLFDTGTSSIWPWSGILADSEAYNTSTESISYRVASAGTYYVAITAYDGVGAYTLSWSIAAGGPDDDIPGIPLPASPVVGSADEATDIDDVYSVYLDAGEIIDVVMTGNSANDFDLELLAPGISSIFAPDYGSFILDGSYMDASDEHVRFTASVSGTYYVYVYAYKGSGSYTLTWSAGMPVSTPLSVYRFYRPSTGTHFYTADATEMQRVRDTMSATYSFEGVGYSINASNPANSVPLYRFYNLRTGTHLYTADAGEKNTILATLSGTYSLDGVAYNVSMTTGTQVYRFYSPSKGVHFYSSDPTEIAYVRANLGHIWSYEGPAYLVGQ